MTTSISNAPLAELPRETATSSSKERAPVELVRTLASRLIIVTLCAMLVLSTLAYGTVHAWALAFFEIIAAALVVLWVIDAWRSRTLRLSRNSLQWPLIGFGLLGLVQLLPLRTYDAAGTLSEAPVRSLSIDPYSTRLALVQLAALLIYFFAALLFIDSPKRLRLIVRTIIVFGFFLALFGIMQNFTSPTKVYWVKDLPQSTPFGPFFNRHHFASYVLLAMALPLGLLFSGAIDREKRPLYGFAAGIMGVALIMTGSRGGLIGLAAELVFLVAITGLRRGENRDSEREAGGRVKAALTRAGLAAGLLVVLLAGALMLGGEGALSRMLGTVNTDDPTTGRSHFWSVTINIIRDHPIAGTGLGSYGLAYTQYDSRNGLYRVEQAHNDYLQLLSDAGVIGGVLGLVFVGLLFKSGFARRESYDRFRSGVATGALGGCFGVLVHSFFDFTLHTTANALLFLVLAALATLDRRVEDPSTQRRRRRRRKSIRQPAIKGADESLLPSGS